MGNYNISCEINLNAENPIEAAKIFEKWLKDEGRFHYYVQDNDTDKIYSVDLGDDDDDVDECLIDNDDYIPIISD